MTIFGKRKLEEAGVAVIRNEFKAPGPAAAAAGASAAAPASGAAAATGAGGKPEGSKLIVGANIRLTGSEIADCDTVIVEGRVEATVDGRVMQISETGNFAGTVSIDMAEIRGRFEGELTVRRRLTVWGTGKVSGRIRYGTLVVEEGGELSGDVDSLEKPAKAPAAEARPTVPGGTSVKREAALPQGHAGIGAPAAEGSKPPTLPPRPNP